MQYLLIYNTKSSLSSIITPVATLEYSSNLKTIQNPLV